MRSRLCYAHERYVFPLVFPFGKGPRDSEAPYHSPAACVRLLANHCTRIHASGIARRVVQQAAI